MFIILLSLWGHTHTHTGWQLVGVSLSGVCVCSAHSCCSTQHWLNEAAGGKQHLRPQTGSSDNTWPPDGRIHKPAADTMWTQCEHNKTSPGIRTSYWSPIRENIDNNNAKAVLHWVSMLSASPGCPGLKLLINFEYKPQQVFISDMLHLKKRNVTSWTTSWSSRCWMYIKGF